MKFRKSRIVRPPFINGGDLGLRQAATRCGYPVNVSSTYKRMMSLSGHIATSNIAGLQLVIGNSGGSPEVADGGATDVTAGIEYPVGTTPTQVLFSGVAQGSIASGGYIVSDWTSLAKPIPKGALFRVRIWRRNTVNLAYYTPSCGHTGLFGDSARRSTTDDTATVTDETLTTTVPGDNNGGNHYAPIAILTWTREPGVAFIGDSRCDGQYDVVDADGSMGIVARSLTRAGIGWSSFAAGGTTVANFNSGHANRGAIGAAYFTHVITGYPINDFGASATLATVQSRMQTLWNTFPGQIIGACTCEPSCSSAGGNWVSDADQTAQAYAITNVPAFNDWIKSLPAPVKFACDTAAAVQSPTDRTKWASDGTNKKYTGTDGSGVHGTQFANIAMAVSGVINRLQFRR